MRGSKEPSPRNQGPLYYLEKGFAVAAVGYRLSDEVHFPGAVHDAKAAVDWHLRQNVGHFDINREENEHLIDAFLAN